jgi:hypothetical protein
MAALGGERASAPERDQSVLLAILTGHPHGEAARFGSRTITAASTTCFGQPGVTVSASSSAIADLAFSQ